MIVAQLPSQASASPNTGHKAITYYPLSAGALPAYAAMWRPFEIAVIDITPQTEHRSLFTGGACVYQVLEGFHQTIAGIPYTGKRHCGRCVSERLVIKNEHTTRSARLLVIHDPRDQTDRSLGRSCHIEAITPEIMEDDGTTRFVKLSVGEALGINADIEYSVYSSRQTFSSPFKIGDERRAGFWLITDGEGQVEVADSDSCMRTGWYCFQRPGEIMTLDFTDLVAVNILLPA